jgi:hypothetical protein
MSEMILSKCCVKCNETKRINRFYKNRTRACGRDSYCSDCRKEYMNNRMAAFQIKNDVIANNLRISAIENLKRALNKAKL